jgi:hypothetical protein
MQVWGYVFCAAMILPLGASAEEWSKLDNEGIEAALVGQTVDYDKAWQVFRQSGATLYNAGRDSWGRWETRDNQYCSQWPPADGWVCYDVEVSGKKVRFTGESGNPTDGVFR